MKPILTAAEMRDCDRRATNERLLAPIVLMERAAYATFELIRGRYDLTGTVILCGVGNNGGDGAALARMIADAGFRATVVIVGDEIHATEETRTQLTSASRSGVRIYSADDPKVDLDRLLSDATLAVDAIFGIGLTRAVEGIYKLAIEALNRCGKPVVSLDIPSGVFADSGAVPGCAVKAELTATYAYYKRGLLLYPGAAMAGEVVLLDAGIHTLEACHTHFLEKADLAMIPKRGANTHKGSYGRVFCICGACGMAGAAYLSAHAAYATGAGLVEVMTDEANRGVIQSLVPEAIFTPIPEDGDIGKSLARASSVVIGPGLGVSERTAALLETVLVCSSVPIVADADALNTAAAYEIPLRARVPIIITPHMLEMQRISGIPVAELKRDPVGAAAAFADEHGLICILKDARSVISDGREVCINVSGNNGMATGGSGDVLTGVIASLIAQGASPFDGARVGTYLHGLAGDAACERRGAYSMTARDIVSGIGDVLKEII